MSHIDQRMTDLDSNRIDELAALLAGYRMAVNGRPHRPMARRTNRNEERPLHPASSQ
jgi:hypothetical protein